MHDTNPSPDYIHGALLHGNAPREFADKVSQAYGAVLLRGDEEKTTRLQLTLSSLFREKGFHGAALAILARPSGHVSYADEVTR